MTRRTAIPASLTVMVGLPFLVATLPQPAAPQTQAPAVDSAVSVETADRDVNVRIGVVGDPPAEVAGRVATADGLASARVESKSQASCRTEKLRLVAIDGEAKVSEWCLAITGLPAHGELSGTISGTPPGKSDSATALAVTVQRREAFGERALWVLLGGLAAGLAVSLFLPFLTSGVTGGRLGLLVARNSRRRRRDRIGDLSDWVDARRAGGKSAGDLLTALGPVVRKGPTMARAARKALTDRLAGHPLPNVHALMASARKEAGRTGHRVGDFLDADLSEVPHPATTFYEALPKMVTLREEIEALDAEMRDKVKPECWPPEVGAAELAWARLADPADIAALGTQIQTARSALDVKLRSPDCRTGTEAALGGTARSLGWTLPDPLDLGQAGATLLVVWWALLTAVAIAVALAFAFATVWLAAYDAKPTFGSDEDLFALFSAALGSGAAATVLGLVAPWRDAPADGGES